MAYTPATKPNYLYAIIGVSMVLFLVGLLALLILQGDNLIRHFKEKIEIVIELKDGSTPSDRSQIANLLTTSGMVVDQSIRFIPKEEGAIILARELGDEFSALDMANPLYDVMIFNVKANYLQSDSLSLLRSRLREMPYVNDVYFQEDVTEAISKNLRSFTIVMGIIGLLGLLVAVVLIHNTIRLALYANRFIIKNMELVGATWGMISRPYLIRSMLHGAVAGLLACAALSGVGYLLLENVPELYEMISWEVTATVFGGITILGVLISLLSTYFVVNRYLRMRVDDLY